MDKKRHGFEGSLLMVFVTLSVAYVGLFPGQPPKNKPILKQQEQTTNQPKAPESCDFPPKPGEKECKPKPPVDLGRDPSEAPSEANEEALSQKEGDQLADDISRAALWSSSQPQEPAVVNKPTKTIKDQTVFQMPKQFPARPNTIIIKKLVKKTVNIQQVIKNNTSVSVILLARPNGVYFENNGSITTIQNHYQPDIGILYQRDFDDIRATAGLSIGGVAFVGAGFTF